MGAIQNGSIVVFVANVRPRSSSLLDTAKGVIWHTYLRTYMEFAHYSLAMIFAFVITRWVTENFKFHIRSNSIWMHHWIVASLAMVVILYFKIDSPLIWGGLSGVALEGLGRKNWSIRRNSGK